jgi:hypothetical protein
MIYGDAEAWRPASVERLRARIDGPRPAHFLAG